MLSPPFRDNWLSNSLKQSGKFPWLTPTHFPVLFSSNTARLQKRKTEAPAEPLASGPRKSMEGRGNARLDASPDISGRAGFSVLCSLECDMSLPGRLRAALLQPRPPQPGPATLAAPPGLLAAHGCPAVARRQAGSPAS